jgi:hypothetical protein
VLYCFLLSMGLKRFTKHILIVLLSCTYIVKETAKEMFCSELYRGSFTSVLGETRHEVY